MLFAGDVVMNNSFVAANQNSSMKAWLAAFDLFATLEAHDHRAGPRRHRARLRTDHTATGW